MMIVLNPSPFDAYLDRCDWNKIDVFFINEVEVRRSAEKRRRKISFAWFREHHPKALVVLTLGGAGSCCMKDGQVYRREVIPATAVDTTAAGDIHRFSCGLTWAGKRFRRRWRWRPGHPLLQYPGLVQPNPFPLWQSWTAEQGKLLHGAQGGFPGAFSVMHGQRIGNTIAVDLLFVFDAFVSSSRRPRDNTEKGSIYMAQQRSVKLSGLLMNFPWRFCIRAAIMTAHC